MVSLPLLAALCVAIRLETRGPALFRQERIGRDGVPFTMLKLRSMGVAAEAERTGLTLANEKDGVLFKIQHDPRVTPLGRRLRRYSLDELPQLWNVVRGDMSLVGPRPALPCEVARYDIDPRRRLVVKPGVTGLWQVSGRSDLSWAESVRLDLKYVDNWSLRPRPVDPGPHRPGRPGPPRCLLIATSRRSPLCRPSGASLLLWWLRRRRPRHLGAGVLRACSPGTATHDLDAAPRQLRLHSGSPARRRPAARRPRRLSGSDNDDDDRHRHRQATAPTTPMSSTSGERRASAPVSAPQRRRAGLGDARGTRARRWTASRSCSRACAPHHSSRHRCPDAASARGRLVTSFPLALRPTRATRVETSSISPSGNRLQVALVASTSLAPADVLLAYRTRLAGRGLVEQAAPPAIVGSQAAAFRRGRSTVTVTATPQGSGTSYSVQASLHTGGE